LIDIVVANEYPQMFSDRATAALGARDVVSDPSPRDRSSEISVVLGKRIQGMRNKQTRFESEIDTWFSRRVQQRERSRNA
jgi:hypothetical protein